MGHLLEGNGAEPPEELLAGDSSRRSILVVALVGVLIAAALVAYLVTQEGSTSTTSQQTESSGTPSASASTSVAANDVLVPGRSTGSSLDDTGRAGYTAELVNVSQRVVTVAYPILLSGVPEGSVALRYAVLARKSAGMDAGSRPPHRLRYIAAQQHVVLSIGLQIQCVHSEDHPSWPIARTIIAIPLIGFSAPATFSFAGIFSGLNTASEIRRMCASREHP